MSGYMGFLPAFVRHSDALTSHDKLMYAELTSLCNSRGGWTIEIETLGKVFTLNDNQIREVLNKLHDVGLITRDGNILYIVDKPTAAKATPELDPAFVHEVIDTWNLLFKDDLTVGIRKTDKLVRFLTERQASFSKEEIMSAIVKRHGYVNRDNWYNEGTRQGLKGNIFLLLKDDAEIERYLNIPDSKTVDMKKTVVAVKKSKVDNSLLE